MNDKKQEARWHETVAWLLSEERNKGFAREILEFQKVGELRRLVRHFCKVRNMQGITGVAIAGLNKAACIDWLLETPGVEFASRGWFSTARQTDDRKVPVQGPAICQ